MSDRQSIEDAQNDSNLNQEQKRKLLLSQKARDFAFNELKLKKTDNYGTFINLNRPYVSWVVHAAHKWELKNYEWSYPFIGKMPYKGFFSEKEAEIEAQEMQRQGFDTLVRGVSAYSTLGYFTDSVLSTMLRYKDHDLVNTIIHEIVHTTLYIKNNADFNEQLAVFIGNKGTELFYKQLEGDQSATLKTIQNENHDDFLFSKFISDKVIKLREWYTQQNTQNDQDREDQFRQIKTNFTTELAPKLKTQNYKKFSEQKLNNAYLGLHTTYMQNLDDFETVFQKLDKNLVHFIEVMKTLEKSKDPRQDLKNL